MTQTIAVGGGEIKFNESLIWKLSKSFEINNIVFDLWLSKRFVQNFSKNHLLIYWDFWTSISMLTKMMQRNSAYPYFLENFSKTEVIKVVYKFLLLEQNLLKFYEEYFLWSRIFLAVDFTSSECYNFFKMKNSLTYKGLRKLFVKIKLNFLIFWAFCPSQNCIYLDFQFVRNFNAILNF